MVIIISVLVAILISSIAYKLISPLPNLSSRMSPYDSVIKVRLSKKLTSNNNVGILNGKFIFEFLMPLFTFITNSLLRISGFENNSNLKIQLKHAGIEESSESYKIKIIKKILISTSVGILLGAAIGNLTSLLFFSFLFCFIGITKSKSSLEKQIEKRKESIREELFTINQLLSIYIKTGSGVTQSISNVTNGTIGVVSNELNEVINRVKSGESIENSLQIAASNTPEKYAARTYKLLASASNRGVDLTAGLMDLANDLRRSLREDIKASSAKKRAAMLIPTIGILAPIMLLFVAAPIPSIVLAGR